jgi:hypothetical protein
MPISVVLASGTVVLEDVDMTPNDTVKVLRGMVAMALRGLSFKLITAQGQEVKDYMLLGRLGLVDGAVVYAIIHPMVMYTTEQAFAALMSDGSVVTWGCTCNWGNCNALRAQLAADVQDIYSTRNAFAALKSDGSVVTWGRYWPGGNRDAVRVQLAAGVQKIYSTGNTFAALKIDGSVLTWGGCADFVNPDTVLAGLSADFQGFYSNNMAFAGVKSDGSVVTWGHEDFGGNCDNARAQLTAGVQHIYSTDFAFAALKSNGSVVTWGDPDFGGNCDAVCTQLAAGVQQIYHTRLAFAALKVNGSVVTWGHEDFGGNCDSVRAQLSADVQQISFTISAFAALKTDGSVVTWGHPIGSSCDATRAQLAAGVHQIYSSSYDFAALTSDGSVVTLGQQDGFSNAKWAQLSGGVQQIYSTSLAFAALTSNGSVVTWGDFESGGNSDAVLVQLAANVQEIYSTCTAFAAVKSDGSVVTWGNPSCGGNSDAVRVQLATGVTPFVLSLPHTSDIQKASPEYPADFDNASAGEIEKRRDILEKACVEDMASVLQTINNDWEEMLSHFPDYVRASLAVDAKEMHRKGCYYRILEEIVSSRCDQVAEVPRAVAPKVNPSEGVSAEEGNRRRRVLKGLTSNNLNFVDEQVKAKWQDEVSCMPDCLRTQVPREPPSEFYKTHYYDILFKIYANDGEVADRGSGSPIHQAAVASARLAIAAGTDSVISPGLGMASILDGTAIEVSSKATDILKLEFIGSAELLAHGATCSLWNYEGVLLEWDKEARRVNHKVKDGPQSPAKKQPVGGRVAMDILLADNTGPVMVTLWDVAAKEFFLTVEKLSQADPDGKSVCRKTIVSLNGMKAGDLPNSTWNGNIVTRMKVLHSIPKTQSREGTLISVIEAPSSPYLKEHQFHQPQSEVCVARYFPFRAKMSGAFRGTFKGMIADPLDSEVSRNGNLKKIFSLVDEEGYWFTCCALGRNATSRCLTNGTEVVVFNGTGRACIGSSSVMIYLMKDAVVIPVGRRFPLTAKKIQI